MKNYNLYTKLMLFVFFIAVAMVISHPLYLLPFIMLSTLITILSGGKLIDLLPMLKTVVGIAFFLILFNAFIYDPEAANTDFARKTLITFFEGEKFTLRITGGGLLIGLGFLSKMVLMVIATRILALTTKIEEIVYALEKIKVPYQIGLMLSIALRFMPTLQTEVSQIQQAQRARGAGLKNKENGKKAKGVQGVIPLFVPMIVSAMRRSDTMAMSMTSRGYGFTKSRTQIFKEDFGLNQIFILIVIIFIIAFLIYLRTNYNFGLI